MEKKINFVFDISAIVEGIANERGNGISFCAYNMLKEFLKRDNLNIIAYCSPEKLPYMYQCFEKDSIIKNIAKLDIYNNFAIESLIIRYEILKAQSEQKNQRRFIKFILALLKTIKTLTYKFNAKKYSKLLQDIDIFFSPLGAIPDEISIVKHIKKCNVLHDIIPLVLPGYKKGFKNGPFYKLFKTLNKNDLYFANSEYTKNDFIKYFSKINPDNITVIPLSTGADYKQVTDLKEIEQIKNKYKIPADKKYLFSLCMLEPRKNVIFAIKNFLEFVKKNKIDDFVYVLGGNSWGNFEDKLKSEIPDIENYADKIIKIGYVQDEDMSSLYSGAEMFVFPSLYEGFGMPILEAMKCACPVICSNLTSMPEVIGDCGIQINPKEDNELIKAFEKMYFDEEFRKQCSIQGLKRSQYFTWERCIDVILNKLGVEQCQKSLL